jgi:hypothetical protein
LYELKAFFYFRVPWLSLCSLPGTHSEKSGLFGEIYWSNPTKSWTYKMAEYDGNSLPSPVVSEHGEKRTRTFTHKGFQNTLINQTKTFNKQTKALRVAIDLVYKAIEENSAIKEALDSLEKERRMLVNSVKSLEVLFAQDKWGEATDVEPTIRKALESFLHAAEFVLQEAAKKLDSNESRVANMSSVMSRRLRTSVKTGSTHSSLHSEKRMAMAEAAAAKEQAEYNRLIAQVEKDWKQREAQEMLERSAAQEQNEHDIAVLAARKLEAVAQAKLEAIERSIIQEEDDSYSGKSSRKASVEPLERTKAWVESQPPFEGEVVRKIKREVNDEFNQTLPHPTGRRSERHRIYETQEPSRVVQQCMGAIATTNEKLTASLAKLSLPKCHPDVFSGDATMFHPWKSTFQGMIESCNVTPENEMNYLCMYTTGEPRKLVNSYRKRCHKDLEKMLMELWMELEKRFGNVTVITNAFLTRLRESAKFGEYEKKKLQAFSDLCSDVISQVSQLPGLACLNYPNAI